MRGTTKYPEKFTKKDYKKFGEADAEKLIQSIVDAMTPSEKFDFVGGSVEPKDKSKIGNAGYQWGCPRLGIPESVLYDGPAGVTGIIETTGLPQPALLGSTWDESLAYDFGKVAAMENRVCSGNYQLSPQVDTIHSPHFGRNKDMKSEDSFLVAKLSVAETKATQDQNVIATIKHFAVANTMGTKGPGDMPDTRVDEQSLHETYLLPFESCVKEGGTGAIMNSYNRVNGDYTTHSKDLNIEILRNQWGYKGSLMADWGSVHDFTLNTGMDLEMPYSAYNNADRIVKHLVKGDITMDEVDLAVKHILYGMNTAGLLGLVEVGEDGLVKEEPHRTKPIQMEWTYEEAVESGMLEENQKVAIEILEKGAVLLKNENNTLPIKEFDPEKVAVIGLGAKYPLCGQQQERSYGRLERMVSGAQALSEEFDTTVEPLVGIDYLGEIIPEEVLFQDEACTKNGVIRTVGILPEDQKIKDNIMQEMMSGAGAAFMGMAAEDEFGERVETFIFGWAEKEEPDERLGEVMAIDKVIDFTTKSKNYVNAPDGNAFESGSYTWKSFLKVENSGSYNLKLQCIGGNATFLIKMDGKWEIVSESRTRENTQWPWDSVVCSETGMGLTGRAVPLQKDHVYPIMVIAEQTVIKKDLQIRVAWSTPQYREENYNKAVEAAAKADTIILYATNSEENESQMQIIMNSLARRCHINDEQQRLIVDIGKAKKEGAKLIVIVQTSNAVATGYWSEYADAIITAYHTGQEGSRVLAGIMSGRINPTGKLSQTWPKLDEDTPLSDTEEHYIERYHGFETESGFRNVASEGIFFGYRWYDKFDVEPAFEFGHGLSYTMYDYQNISVAKNGNTFDVSLDVINVGSVAGDEIVQVYLGEAEVPQYIQMAKKQLAGFMRVKGLNPGEMRHITITVDERCLSYWDPCRELVTRDDGTKDKWQRALGKRMIYVGASSRDIRLEKELTVE